MTKNSRETADQIAKVMLLQGTPEQQAEALAYCFKTIRFDTNYGSPIQNILRDINDDRPVRLNEAQASQALTFLRELALGAYTYEEIEERAKQILAIRE